MGGCGWVSCETVGECGGSAGVWVNEGDWLVGDLVVISMPV